MPDQQTPDIPKDLTIETVQELYDRLAQANLYDRLGVAPTAPIPEIRRVYIERVRELHPDVHFHKGEPGVAALLEQVLMLLNESREVLFNALTRREYDRKLRSEGTEAARTESVMSPEERRAAQARDKFKEGLHALNMGALHQAVMLLRAAVHMQPDDPTYRTHLARALMATDELHEARREARAAHRLDPNNPEVLIVLGQVYDMAGLRRNALRYYREALNHGPQPEVAARVEELVAEEEAEKEAEVAKTQHAQSGGLFGRLFRKK